MQKTLALSSASAPATAYIQADNLGVASPSSPQADMVTLVLTVPASDLSAALAGHEGSMSVEGASLARATVPAAVEETSTSSSSPRSSISATRTSFSSSSRDFSAVTNDKAALLPSSTSTRTITMSDARNVPSPPSSSSMVMATRLVPSSSSIGSAASPPTTSQAQPSLPGSSQAMTTIRVAAIPSIAIKPVVPGQTDTSGTDTMVVYVPAPSTTDNGNSNNSDFLHSLGTSPVNIALTALVCTGIAVLLVAAVAFFLRRFRRRASRRNVTQIGGVHVDHSYSRYSDGASAYDDDAQPIMHQVTAPSIRSQAHSYEGRGGSIYNQQQSRTFDPSYQFGASTAQNNIIDTENEKLREEDWNNEMLQVRRKSEMDLSLVQHLHASQPFATPSIMQSSASQIFNYAPTVASSLYLEPALGQQLRSTYLGSFSASAPTQALPIAGRMTAVGSAQSGSLLVPPRPNRPASLTSSFTHAIERDLAVNPVSPPTYVSSPAAAPVHSAWGVRTISQVFNATTDAVTAMLSPTPASPTYDEEKADCFTALPDPASARRPSVRWGSVTSLNSNAQDRRVCQQMPSRFSVTTLGTALTNSPSPSCETTSAYDYQIQSVAVASRRAAPVLIAQREMTPPASELDLNDLVSSDSSTLTDQVGSTPVSTQEAWASTEPLSTPSRRPSLARLESIRSVDTVQSSIFDNADEVSGGYAMTEEEQQEMRALIHKRRAAALSAK